MVWLIWLVSLEVITVLILVSHHRLGARELPTDGWYSLLLSQGKNVLPSMAKSALSGLLWQDKPAQIVGSVHEDYLALTPKL